MDRRASRPPVVVPLLLAAAFALLAACDVGVSTDAGPEETPTVTVTVTEPPRDTGAPDTDADPSGPVVAPSGPVQGPMSVLPPGIDGPVVGWPVVRSPSGNVVCSLSGEEDLHLAECMVREREYDAPPEPADCELDWEPWFVVGEEARFGQCRSDTIDVSGARDLPYGTTSVQGRIACRSEETGMTCWNTHTGHGFRAARADFELF